MNPFISLIVFLFAALPASTGAWLISFFGFDQTFWMSSGIALGTAFISYISIKGLIKRSYLKKHQLTSKEYAYIKKNLKEAKSKIGRLQKALIASRSIPSFKQNVDILRVTRKIYSITKKEPKRFYQAERFYFYHLDSLVEITEKYAFLKNQPKKAAELEISLFDTRQVIKELTLSIEKDLNHVLSNDINQLNFELDVIKTRKDDESRRL
ncbi:5-bromo-4-chloroindolyl phosphate hydrolysis family protein [Bacillus sp. 31A1R]|uniref:5-bromo-4-chloroindolyl phosphate hydrolysis family protein n=1 Tax=Robertmurraya mangrovi TaxID=3098077 RepID=A0ABU5IXP4_9BACI|nr:5-bromo-4-chloroindolyl phosphate hydrolysis family protein [Bacillus sp. 31A1R]MDZ5471897.1 5-bromo-4-chloroindolyl phosphate hydrolysis family protein [Bacillus sp. 31A1R]